MSNIYQGIPQDLSSEVFENLIESDNVTIERIISMGQSSPQTGWYQQAKNEWVIILEGEAEIVFETGSPKRLVAGDYLNIEAHRKHKVSQTAKDRKTIWLAIHY